MMLPSNSAGECRRRGSFFLCAEQRLRQVPAIFPVIREFPAENGSYATACTSTELCANSWWPISTGYVRREGSGTSAHYRTEPRTARPRNRPWFPAGTKDLDGGAIAMRPVQAGSGQQLDVPAVQPRMHAVAVILDLVQPVVAAGRFLNQAREPRLDPFRRCRCLRSALWSRHQQRTTYGTFAKFFAEVARTLCRYLTLRLREGRPCPPTRFPAPPDPILRPTG